MWMVTWMAMMGSRDRPRAPSRSRSWLPTMVIYVITHKRRDTIYFKIGATGPDD